MSQTPEQKEKINEQIPNVMDHLIQDMIAYQLDKFGDLFERRLGLTHEDLISDIMEQVWKGLVTHKANGKANLKTYLNRLIDNRFKSLLRKASLRKHSFVDYYMDPNDASRAELESKVTEDTGETVFERRHEFIKDLAYLGAADRLLLAGLSQGYDITELMAITNTNRQEVIANISRIDLILKKRRERV